MAYNTTQAYLDDYADFRYVKDSRFSRDGMSHLFRKPNLEGIVKAFADPERVAAQKRAKEMVRRSHEISQETLNTRFTV